MLDEPSTGVDPVARRSMWNVVSKGMPRRATILTTHNLEEAEALCPLIAIMVNGEFKCLGSAQHLKSRFGQGYNVEVEAKNAQKLDDILAMFQSLCPTSHVSERFGGRARISLPASAMPLSHLFRCIEEAKESLSISDYCVGQTTLEQIFIGFSRMQEEADLAAEALLFQARANPAMQWRSA